MIVAHSDGGSNDKSFDNANDSSSVDDLIRRLQDYIFQIKK